MRIILILLLFSPIALAGEFTEEQKHILNLAKEEGEKFDFPETIQAIALQETIAGHLGPVGDLDKSFGQRSYCAMQIKLSTAREVVEKYQLGIYPTDEELLAELLTDDRFCIQVGATYWWMLYNQLGSWRQAVLAYNVGATGSYRGYDPNDYVNKVWGHIVNKIRPWRNDEDSR